MPSKHLVAVINEHLSGLQPDYIQLIRFFLLACSNDSHVTAKEPSDDHLFQLLCPPKSSGENLISIGRVNSIWFVIPPMQVYIPKPYVTPLHY